MRKVQLIYEPMQWCVEARVYATVSSMRRAARRICEGHVTYDAKGYAVTIAFEAACAFTLVLFAATELHVQALSHESVHVADQIVEHKQVSGAEAEELRATIVGELTEALYEELIHGTE